MSAAGCMSKKYRDEELTGYTIFKSGPFILSDSPELWKFLHSRRTGEVAKSFELFVSNADIKDHSLELEKATMSIDKEIRPLKCQIPTMGNNLSYRLEPAKVIKLICNMDIPTTDLNGLRDKDAYIRFDIPTDGKVISFERLYRIEDFK
jgi:hypothetical protein